MKLINIKTFRMKRQRENSYLYFDIEKQQGDNFSIIAEYYSLIACFTKKQLPMWIDLPDIEYFIEANKLSIFTIEVLRIEGIKEVNVLPIVTPFKFTKYMERDIIQIMKKEEFSSFFSECPQFYSDSTVSNYKYRIELKKEGSKGKYLINSMYSKHDIKEIKNQESISLFGNTVS